MTVSPTFITRVSGEKNIPGVVIVWEFILFKKENNTANIYSISDSSKFGGKIGWIEEKKLSKKIIQELQSIETGQYTAPLQKGASFLILKIEEIKYEKTKINEDEELNRMIQFETSKQLDQFSKIFYKKIKINTRIDEL